LKGVNVYSKPEMKVPRNPQLFLNEEIILRVDNDKPELDQTAVLELHRVMNFSGSDEMSLLRFSELIRRPEISFSKSEATIKDKATEFEEGKDYDQRLCSSST
jgi:hypothetical protein